MLIEAGALSLTGSMAFGQAPSSGQMLESIRERAPAVVPSPERAVVRRPAELELPAGSAASPARVAVQRFIFEGNSSVATEQLEEALADLRGQEHDLRGLQSAARRITELYRSRGYLVARAYLPAQDVRDGQLRIAVQEGLLGDVRLEITDRVRVDPKLVAQLVHALQNGAALREASLERALLLLSDVPALSVDAVLRPGTLAGHTDVLIRLDEAPAAEARLVADNHGNRHVGRLRAGVDLAFNDAFGAGEQVTMRLLTTFEGLAAATASVSVPVGGSGLRAGVGLSHLEYRVGRELAELRANGRATVANAWLSYPLLRSRRGNLSVQVGAEHKRLVDEIQSVGSSIGKYSDLMTVGVRGNWRDLVGGGANTVLGAQIGAGRLRRATPSDAEADALTAGTAGRFEKLNAQLSRWQALGQGWSMIGSLSGQLASKNLDSSEKFHLGGPQGVRAYAQGETAGDEAWLATIELRRALGEVGGYRAEGAVFYDAGEVRLDRNPWDPTQASNRIRRHGGGFGLSLVNDRALAVSMSVAFRARGAATLAEQANRGAQFWFQVSGAPQHLASALRGEGSLSGSGSFGFYGSLGLMAEVVRRNDATPAGPRGATQSAPPSGENLGSFLRLRDPTSYVGVRGELPITPGTAAFWQIETGLSYVYNRKREGAPAGDSSVSTTLRDSGVGVRGRYGSMLHGKWDMPMKELSQEFDPFGGNTIASHTNLIGSPGFGVTGAGWVSPLTRAEAENNDDASFNRRQSGVWLYESPSIARTKLRLAYSDNGRTAAPGVGPGHLWGASLRWRRGGLKAGVAYERHTDHFGVASLGRNNRGVGASASSSVTAGTSSRDWSVRLGVEYAFSATEVSLILDRLSYKEFGVVPAATVPDLSAYTRDAWLLGLSHRIGKWTMRASVGEALKGQCETVSDDPSLRACDTTGLGANMVAVGFRYGWSPRVTLFGHYAALRNRPSSSYNVGVGGVIAQPGRAAGVGSDPQGVGAGISYSF
jgi:hemolysin activation/secretion protein/predicted porin